MINMTGQEAAPTYFDEYRSAFVPTTTERGGVITDVYSGNQVDRRAVDPGYPHYPGAIVVNRSVQSAPENVVNPMDTPLTIQDERDRAMGRLAPPTMFA